MVGGNSFSLTPIAISKAVEVLLLFHIELRQKMKQLHITVKTFFKVQKLHVK